MRLPLVVLTLTAVLSISATVAAEEPIYQIAVSPFANAGADKGADYIGFQTSEFLSNAMAGFPGVRVIERSQLMRILEEQELQLSGITEGGKSVSIGQILNARQIVVGSFELSATRLLLNSRIVEVSSGAVLSRALVETPLAESYAAAYKALLFQLVSGLPEYRMTIDVEARIENISEQSASPAAQAAEDYSKALAALYNKDDKAALDYLQKAMASAQVGFIGFGDAADRYVETLTRARGSSRYAKMVQKQVETNKTLMEQIEPLSLYRATLKILKARTEALLASDAFAITGNPAEAVEFHDGSVSTRVVLPASVEIELKASARTKIESLFVQQEVARLGATGIVFTPPPAGGLLSPAALRGQFEYRLLAYIPHAVQFLDTKGTVVYELLSDPAAAISLTAGSSSFSAAYRPTYRPAAYREGWAFLADGSLEIQARALADLDTVRYALRPESLRIESSFGLDSDLRWRSLVSHAYRMRSIKVAAQDEELAPQFKDIVVTDSFFETEDPELGRIPMLPRNGRVAGFAALTAVVYFADNAKDAVNISWHGAINGLSELYVGDLGPNTVLYFKAPDPYTMRYGQLEVTARLGQAQVGKSAAVILGNGLGWATGWDVDGYAIDGARAFTTQVSALSLAGAAVEWYADGALAVIADAASLYVIDRQAIRRLDKKSGVLQGRGAEVSSRSSVYSVALEADRLFVLTQDALAAFDAKSGTLLWQYGQNGKRMFRFTFALGRLYCSNGSVLEAATGASLFNTPGNGEVTVSNGRVYWGNGFCAELETGREIWFKYNPDMIGTPLPSGETVYFGGRAALSVKDGSVIWSRKGGQSNALLSGGKLYAWDDHGLVALDPATGGLLWSTTKGWGARQVSLVEGSLYAVLNRGLTRLDLSIFERELDAGELTTRGSLGVRVTFNQPVNMTAGVFVTNIAVGGSAAAAGIMPGDRITDIDGVPIRAEGQFADLLFEHRKGDKVAMSYERFDRAGNRWAKKEIKATLGGSADEKPGAVLRPGLSLGTIDQEGMTRLNISSYAYRNYFIVESVAAGSAAAAAGFMIDDLLLELGTAYIYDNNPPYQRLEHLYGAISAAVQGKTALTVTVLRKGKKTVLSFKP